MGRSLSTKKQGYSATGPLGLLHDPWTLWPSQHQGIGYFRLQNSHGLEAVVGWLEDLDWLLGLFVYGLSCSWTGNLLPDGICTSHIIRARQLIDCGSAAGWEVVPELFRKGTS